MTPTLRVTEEVFARFPEVVLGVVVAHGIDNTGDGSGLAGPLRQEEERVRASLTGIQVAEHPHIAPWREAYRQFGAKPKDHSSSIENLARRVLKGWSVPHVNPLVDVRQPDWRKRITSLLDDVVALTTRLGGTLTGEHGDGRIRTIRDVREQT